MIRTNTYFPFTPDSTFMLNNSKRPLSDIVSCLLYPEMQDYSLLHISSIENNNGVFKIAISDTNDIEVCYVSDIRRIVGDICYYYVVDLNDKCCGVVAVKNKGRLFKVLPTISHVESNSFIFDPFYVKYNKRATPHVVTYQGIPIDSAKVTDFDLKETDAVRVVKSINGIPAKHFVFTHAPRSTVGIGRNEEGIIVARRSDLV